MCTTHALVGFISREGGHCADGSCTRFQLFESKVGAFWMMRPAPLPDDNATNLKMIVKHMKDAKKVRPLGSA